MNDCDSFLAALTVKSSSQEMEQMLRSAKDSLVKRAATSLERDFKRVTTSVRPSPLLKVRLLKESKLRNDITTKNLELLVASESSSTSVTHYSTLRAYCRRDGCYTVDWNERILDTVMAQTRTRWLLTFNGAIPKALRRLSRASPCTFSSSEGLSRMQSVSRAVSNQISAISAFFQTRQP